MALCLRPKLILKVSNIQLKCTCRPHLVVSVAFLLDLPSYRGRALSGMKLVSVKSVASSCQAHWPLSLHPEWAHSLEWLWHQYISLPGRQRDPIPGCIRASLQSLPLDACAPVIPNAEQVGLVSLGIKFHRSSRAELAPNCLGELRFHSVLLHLHFRTLLTQTKAHLRAASFLVGH